MATIIVQGYGFGGTRTPDGDGLGSVRAIGAVGTKNNIPAAAAVGAASRIYGPAPTYLTKRVKVIGGQAYVRQDADATFNEALDHVKGHHLSDGESVVLYLQPGQSIFANAVTLS